MKFIAFLTYLAQAADGPSSVPRSPNPAPICVKKEQCESGDSCQLTTDDVVHGCQYDETWKECWCMLGNPPTRSNDWFNSFHCCQEPISDRTTGTPASSTKTTASALATLQCTFGDVEEALTCENAASKGWCGFLPEYLADTLYQDNGTSPLSPLPSWCNELKANAEVRPSDERQFYAMLTTKVRALMEQRPLQEGICSVFPIQLPPDSENQEIKVCFYTSSRNETVEDIAKEDCNAKTRNGECSYLLKQRGNLNGITGGKFTLYPDPVLGTGKVFLKVYNKTAAFNIPCPGEEAPTRVHDVKTYSAALLCGEKCHPSRVQKFKYVASDDTFCYAAMEWIEGVTFANFIRSFEKKNTHGPLVDIRFGDIYKMLEDILLALADFHVLGLRHSDLRSPNALVLGFEGNTFDPSSRDGNLYAKLIDLDLMFSTSDSSSYPSYFRNCSYMQNVKLGRDVYPHLFDTTTTVSIITRMRAELGSDWWGYSDVECFYFQLLDPIQKHLPDAESVWINWSEALFSSYVRAVGKNTTRSPHKERGAREKVMRCYLPVNPPLSAVHRFPLLARSFTFKRKWWPKNTTSACPDVNLEYHNTMGFDVTVKFFGQQNHTTSYANRVQYVSESIAWSTWAQALYEGHDAAAIALAEKKYQLACIDARKDFVHSGRADHAASMAKDVSAEWLHCSSDYVCGDGWEKDASKINKSCADGDDCYDSDCCTLTSAALDSNCGDDFPCTRPNTCVLKTDPHTPCRTNLIQTALCTCDTPPQCSVHEVENECANDASCSWASTMCTPKCKTDVGSDCVFPFTFDEENHDGCTNIDEENAERLWCSTGTDVNNEMIWDYCVDRCPRSSTLQQESVI